MNSETTLTKEVSFVKNFLKARFSTTYFDTKLNNKVYYDESVYKYKNYGKSTQSGIEYDVTFNDIKPLSFLSFSYTNLQANDDGERSLRVPDDKVVISLGSSYLKRYSFGLRYTYESDKLDAGNKKINSFEYIDLVTHYDYSDRTKVFFKIHNLTNEKFERVSGFSEPGSTLTFGFNKKLY